MPNHLSPSRLFLPGGITGTEIDDSAFAFLAKAIKSSNKQDFAYLVQVINQRLKEHKATVDKNKRLTQSENNLSNQLSSLQTQYDQLTTRFNQATNDLDRWWLG